MVMRTPKKTTIAMWNHRTNVVKFGYPEMRTMVKRTLKKTTVSMLNPIKQANVELRNPKNENHGNKKKKKTTVGVRTFVKKTNWRRTWG